MNKKELISQISKKSGLKKQEVAELLNVFSQSLAECLAKGEKLTISGFGTFQLSKRRARIGINPRTKEKITISPSVTVHFKPSKKLKEAVK